MTQIRYILYSTTKSAKNLSNSADYEIYRRKVENGTGVL